MYPVTYNPSNLIAVWENGIGKPASDRINDLLECYQSLSKSGAQALDQLSIERREQYLLEMRRMLFGRKFSSIASCPSCEEKIQWDMQYSDFVPHEGELPSEESFLFEFDGFRIRYRLPRETDLELVTTEEIIKNCVSGGLKDGTKVRADQIPTTVLSKLEAEIEKRSPLSSSMINLSCPECDHRWKLHFSVFEFLWMELDQWSRRFLSETGVLAMHYGWSEREIMEMSPVRRSYYLELARS